MAQVKLDPTKTIAMSSGGVTSEDEILIRTGKGSWRAERLDVARRKALTTELTKMLRQLGRQRVITFVHSQNLPKWRGKANTVERLSKEPRHKRHCQ